MGTVRHEWNPNENGRHPRRRSRHGQQGHRIHVMSRSRKKTPVGGVCCDLSEKQNKRDANRALRRRVHAMDLTGDRPIPLLREVSDVWCMIKDGRCYWGDALGPWFMRK